MGLRKKNTEVFCASLNFHFIFFVRRDQSRKTMCGIVQPHTILLHFQVPSLLWKWLSCFLALAFPSLSNGCSVHWGMWVLFYFSLSFNGFHFISQSFLFFSFWGLLLIKSCKFFFFLFCFMDKISCYIALFPSLVIFFLGVFWWIWSASLKGFFVYVAYFSYLFFFYKFYFTIYGVCLLVLYIYIYIYYSLTRVLFDVNNFLVFFPLIVYLVRHYLFNAKTAKKSISLQMRMWLRFFCNNWNFIMGSGLKFGKLGNYPCLILGLSNNLLFKTIRTL